MKIAVAGLGKNVAEHFGHCESFFVYEVEDNAIINAETVQNPGHRPGFLPNFLADLGVNVIIGGGMGGGAIEIFEERGVKVVTGASGDAFEAAQKYVIGALKSTGAVCKEHNH
ncbi:MAG: dinitrogenase iron-molybdenum cofactor [Erysipelotrichia bacterium]|nr:dinitrogenase iron-molybdenum cofactor [Erysipelotrichia bacterium]